MRHLAAVMVVLAAPSLVAAQGPPTAEEERPVYFGIGVGFLSATLHLGVRDVVAHDVDLRITPYMAFHVESVAVGGGVNLQFLWAPGAHSLRGYIGGGLELSYAEDYCIWLDSSQCPQDWNAVYGGGVVTAGFETGSSSARFFVEGGVSVVGNLGELEGIDGPSVMARPRLDIGASFL